MRLRGIVLAVLAGGACWAVALAVAFGIAGLIKACVA
jgi:hypothetical protein